MRDFAIEHEGVQLHYRQVSVPVERLLSEFTVTETNRLHNCTSCGIFLKCWACPGMNDPFTAYNSRNWPKVLLYTFWRDVAYDSDPTRSYASVQQAYQSVAPFALQYGATLERELDGKLMIDGRCAVCRVCTAAMDPPRPCAYPDKLRSSLEALGFNVIRISKLLLEHPLEWHVDRPGGRKRTPGVISVVHGVLTFEDEPDEPPFEAWMSDAATAWIRNWRETSP
jgi:predicted metal-binding protein